jgi:hypothetical protein
LALTFLTTLASVVFAAGAIAGWVLALWPATPLTLLVASVVVLSGPLISVVAARHIGRPEPARAAAGLAPRPVRVRAAEPPPTPARVSAGLAVPPLTAEQAYGRELLDWRDRPWRRRA